MNIEMFTTVMIILFIAMFLVSGALGATTSNEKSASVVLANLWFMVVVVFIFALINNPYYELEKEIKKLVPKMTVQQLKNSGPIVKDLYKEIKFQEYKKNL